MVATDIEEWAFDVNSYVSLALYGLYPAAIQFWNPDDPDEEPWDGGTRTEVALVTVFWDRYMQDLERGLGYELALRGTCIRQRLRSIDGILADEAFFRWLQETRI